METVLFFKFHFEKLSHVLVVPHVHTMGDGACRATRIALRKTNASQREDQHILDASTCVMLLAYCCTVLGQAQAKIFYCVQNTSIRSTYLVGPLGLEGNMLNLRLSAPNYFLRYAKSLHIFVLKLRKW